MNKRLSMLESLTRSENADAFAWYGLAMEYRRENRSTEALSAFQRLRELYPDYLPTYLMAGQLLLADQDAAEARGWLEAGIVVAERAGNDKTLSELREALEECEETPAARE